VKLLRFGALLTFLSRVLRSVVAVAVEVAHRTTSHPTAMPAIAKATTTTITTNSIRHDVWLQPNQLRVLRSAFGLLSFVCHAFTVIYFFHSSALFCRLLCFCLMLPVVAVVVVVVVDIVVAVSRLCVMCAVCLAPVDESVSLRILHEADASSYQSVFSLFERS